MGGDATLACSAATQEQIDKRVVDLVRRQHDKAKALLEGNREKLDELAAYLYEKESITGDEFMRILNRKTAGDLQEDKRNLEHVEAQEEES